MSPNNKLLASWYKKYCARYDTMSKEPPGDTFLGFMHTVTKRIVCITGEKVENNHETLVVTLMLAEPSVIGAAAVDVCLAMYVDLARHGTYKQVGCHVAASNRAMRRRLEKAKATLHSCVYLVGGPYPVVT